MTENKPKNWYLIDADGKILGRIATEIATLLRGKNTADFAPNRDDGNFVVVTNADKVILTGRKEEQKRYYRHTGYLGNLKTATVADLRKKDPTEILRQAVSGMLPHNRLQKVFMKRLKLYIGKEHPHIANKFINASDSAKPSLDR